ncbi:MAG TPA: SDR family NAD(P)-dependent oxidoreductase, partial [Acidimicrobiales bacterium]|nr:SDR family NAD(P)-dependent oxidoreductase [Acidimicrobiales bacterium]
GLPPVPTAAPAPATAPAAAAAPAAQDPVVTRVLEVVAAQTGYPPEMLDLDLDLEADLGIDTVKQAETFAAIREEYGIPRDDNLSLRDYPTLASVVGFVHERATGLPSPDGASAGASSPAPAGAGPELLVGDDEASAAIPRRLAVSVLRPDLADCVPTGITLDASSRVIVALDQGGDGAALVERLRDTGVDVLVIDDAPPADDLLTRIDEWRGDGPVTGLYWLPALDVEDAVTDLDLAAWREALRVRVKLFYRTLRHLYEPLGAPGSFVVAATRLGGRHGYDDEGAVAPMGGAVVGATKTFKRERPDALVKAVDLAAGVDPAAVAELLVAETERDPGAIEVGHRDGRRFVVVLAEQPMPEEPTGMELGPDSVFVVTGAAGSIVSAIIADLARASSGVFHLLDLAPTPDPDDPDLAAFAADRDELKRTIFERLKESGERATPALVERELAGIERRHAALASVQAVEAAGGTAHYHSVNLLDGEAMAAVTDQIRELSGRVDVLLHAGGLEISRLLPDKDPAEFDLVFDVKADGWFNLLAGLGDLDIGAAVVFSSIAGRFGNGGQADYAAANDLLCKWTSSFRSTRPDTIGLAVDWTAWGDIGMATRGSIPTMMRAAGIDMLPAAAGIPIVRRELVGDRHARELLVGQRLGVLVEEWHPSGGLDVDADGPIAPRVGPEHTVVLTGVTGDLLVDGLVATATLDPTTEGFLDDHRIDGTPVLPGVMGVEAFAEIARLAQPDLVVTSVDDIDFLAPVKFFRDEPRELKVTARFVPDGDDVVATCALVGERMLANQDEPQVTVHFTATVRLSPEPNDDASREVGERPDQVVAADDIYRIYFHGPAYQVLHEAWADDDGGAVGLMADELPPNHSAPAATVTDPRLVELCFQTAGVWEIAATGSMALPTHIDSVVLRRSGADAPGPVRAIVSPRGDGSYDAAVIDGEGRVLVELAGYRTIALPGELDAEVLNPLRDGMDGGD